MTHLLICWIVLRLEDVVGYSSQRYSTNADIDQLLSHVEIRHYFSRRVLKRLMMSQLIRPQKLVICYYLYVHLSQHSSLNLGFYQKWYVGKIEAMQVLVSTS